MEKHSKEAPSSTGGSKYKSSKVRIPILVFSWVIRREESINYLGTEVDTIVNKEFIKTELNVRDSNSRSPFTQEYFPESCDDYFCTPKIKEFEVEINKCFARFCKEIYLDCVPSCFISEGGDLMSFSFIMHKKKTNRGEENGSFITIKILLNAKFKSSATQHQSFSLPDCSWKGEVTQDFFIKIDKGDGVKSSISGRVVHVNS